MEFDFNKIKIGQKIIWIGEVYLKIKPVFIMKYGNFCDITLIELLGKEQLYYEPFPYSIWKNWFDGKVTDLIIE